MSENSELRTLHFSKEYISIRFNVRIIDGLNKIRSGLLSIPNVLDARRGQY